MNPVIRIIQDIIILLNRLIDSLDKKTTESIKQFYYLLVIIIVVTGIFIGYNRGKDSAKKFGAPIAEFTDDVFNDLIKTQRENVEFSTMIEGKTIREKEEADIKKQAFPSNEKLEFESNYNIVEPETEAQKIIAEPQSDIRERAADVKRLDEAAPREDIKELERRPQPDTGEKKSAIMKDAGEPLSEINKIESRETTSPEMQKARPIERDKRELMPMDKNDRVLDK